VTEEREIGNIETGFAEADKIIEYSVKRGMNSPAGVEAMACVAQWRGDFLDLWVHHQANPQNSLSSSGMMMACRPLAEEPTAISSVYALVQDQRYLSLSGLMVWGLAWLAYSTSFVRSPLSR